MSLIFTLNPIVQAEQVADLLRRAELNRPEEDAHRLIRIRPKANVVLGAFDGPTLVGLARGLREMGGCCYLSDLIVDRAYQGQGVGEALIRHVREVVGEHAMIMLVRAEDVPVYNTDVE